MARPARRVGDDDDDASAVDDPRRRPRSSVAAESLILLAVPSEENRHDTTPGTLREVPERLSSPKSPARRRDRGGGLTSTCPLPSPSAIAQHRHPATWSLPWVGTIQHADRAISRAFCQTRRTSVSVQFFLDRKFSPAINNPTSLRPRFES